MSGLFRRLAEQASGRATTLHAPARLPFHAAPSASEALAGAAADFSADAPAPTVGPAAPSRVAPQHASAGIEPSGHGSTRTDAATNASGMVSAQETTEIASALEPRVDDNQRNAPPQPTHATRSAHPAHPARVDRRADPSTRHARASANSQEVPAPIAPRAAVEAPPPHTPATANQTADTAASKADAPSRDGPAPPEFPTALLPPHADAARATPAAASARPPSAERRNVRPQRAAADAPDEVHVHIGRIEVTAVRESAPAPRKKKNGRAPMSLDEYVAKRQRGAS